MVSLDGFIEGPNRDIDWHVWDKEMDQYMIDFFGTVDLILLGRVAYQLMESYWPTPAATTDDPIIADKMNNLPKIVFSKTLDEVEWNNTRLVKENITAEISQLKQHPGKDLVLFGGAGIAAAFMQLNLLDEYRIIVNPVVLGSGTPLFKSVKEKLHLKLLKTKTFGSGNVLLCYGPNRK